MHHDTPLKHSKQYLGLGKTLFNSSASVVCSNDIAKNQIILTERVVQRKASGAWPEKAIKILESQVGENFNVISENRDVITPFEFEKAIDSSIPFLSYLKKKKLDQYSSHYNPNIKTLSHHLCHAYAALAMSPYHESIIIVMDGAGSNSTDFSNIISEEFDTKDLLGNEHESCSIYLQKGAELIPIKKEWQVFRKSKIPGHDFSDGIGMLYEKAAEYIFNNKRSAGKVMGLAGFGKPSEITSAFQFLESLDWSQSFQAKTKSEWEANNNIKNFENLAASVQYKYEQYLYSLVLGLKKKYPKINNLILTGGTALNCTNNYKLLEKGLFDNIYVPPFPSDECISFGAANYSFIKENHKLWSPKEISTQHGFLGSKKSIPNEKEIIEIFDGYEVSKPEDIINFSAELLTQNKIIAWFQGRSESGPRALGNRSILANIETPELKNIMNEKIKFRESFRPYGCSVLHEYSSDYFKVSNSFHNPFMSFATPIRSKYLKRLKEVSHIDNTSRMQTVTEEFNPKFYQLIKCFGNKTGLYGLLNTSLNIMGKPIVETIQDAKAFLDSTNVDGIVVADFYIKKN